MKAAQQFRPMIPWAVALGVGVGIGLWLSSILVDVVTNQTCGLLPPGLGVAILTLGSLAVAAAICLIAGFVAVMRSKSATPAGWVLLGVVAAAIVFLVAAANLPPPGCRHTG